MKTDNLRTVSLGEIIGLPAYPVAKLWFIVPGGATSEVRKVDTITLPELADSILENGLLNPLVLYTNEGVTYLLDGRNRREASALAAKVSRTTLTDFMIEVQDFIGTPDEADDFVFVCNDRRDTNSSQRAMSAAMFATDPDCAPAFARMQEKAQTAHREGSSRGGQGQEAGPTLAQPSSDRVNEQLAKRFHVSIGYVKDALRKKRGEIASFNAAVEEAERAEELAKEAENQRLLAEEIRLEDEEKARELIRESNRIANKATEARESANEKSQAASTKASQNKSIWEGRKSLRDQKEDPNTPNKDEREIAIDKAVQGFNDGYNKVTKNGPFLLKEGRPNDQENVRLKFEHMCEKFGELEEIEGAYQTEHYFSTEKIPSDEHNRWGGEVRVRLAGLDQMIQERDILPKLVTDDPEFVGVIDRLRVFLDEVETNIHNQEV